MATITLRHNISLSQQRLGTKLLFSGAGRYSIEQKHIENEPLLQIFKETFLHFAFTVERRAETQSPNCRLAGPVRPDQNDGSCVFLKSEFKKMETVIIMNIGCRGFDLQELRRTSCPCPLVPMLEDLKSLAADHMFKRTAHVHKNDKTSQDKDET